SRFRAVACLFRVTLVKLWRKLACSSPHRRRLDVVSGAMNHRPGLTARAVRQGSISEMADPEDEEAVMGPRSRVLMSVLFLLAMVSCGGDGSSPETTGGENPTTAQDADSEAEPADQSTADETDTADEAEAVDQPLADETDTAG